ncbi:photosystem II protein, Psb35-related [Leptolyngbya sp. AN02str]|uniref:photosystem II protein, Psb35-related n=1 Tax=Leptolyngbya sp. AN02str TaxID=3423363 RepID=UPI003D3129B2
MAFLIALFVIGWVAVAVIGTQAYFRGEQSKPIHERNWRSEEFEALAKSVTGGDIDHNQRVPAFVVSDAYTSGLLPNR